MLGAADSSECAVPPTVAPFNATLFEAAGSCAAALSLFNSLYNTNLTTLQQVREIVNRFFVGRPCQGLALPVRMAGMRTAVVHVPDMFTLTIEPL